MEKAACPTRPETVASLSNSVGKSAGGRLELRVGGRV